MKNKKCNLIPAWASVMLTLFTFSPGLAGQKVLFLHHSTGGNIYSEGSVAEWIGNYNTGNGTSVEISERSYPDSPYPWENYPYDYWNLWVKKNCDSGQPGIECIESLTEDYQVIIFKHCFPGASIQAESGDPDVSSPSKTTGNYKLQYRALRDLMDQYPDNLFIAWTLVPLHRLATNPEDAARAAEFVDWVKNEWLTEDGKGHENIRVFDFWGYAAETNDNPENGEVNCLKYDYEISHTGSDSHPNSLANETIGPLFAEFIVNNTLEFNTPKPWNPANPNASDEVKKVLKFLYAMKGKGILTGQENLATDVLKWTDEVRDITGEYPGLLGEDFSYGDSASVKRQEIVETAVDYWNNGGLVTISWHQVHPQTWDGSINEGPFEYTQYDMSQQLFNQLFVPETDLQITYTRHIDTIATYLKKLQEAGVVVLWRPYHEMNGGWFWWGAKSNFADLWRGMYNRYTKYHHLNNLIWVWGPNISQSDMESYYPGDDYVDIVGLDGYVDIANWDVRDNLSGEINRILNLSKGNVISFTELGVLPDMNWLRSERPEFAWFLCWWTHITDANSNRRINDIYHHDYAMKRGDFLWNDFPVVLVKEFDDMEIPDKDSSFTIIPDIYDHFYWPEDKNLKVDVSCSRDNIDVILSDSIVLNHSPGDTGKIVFTVVAKNAVDSIYRQFTVNLTTGVSIQPLPDPARITIYPNPASEYLQIDGMPDIDEILIYDLAGRLVHQTVNRKVRENRMNIGHLEQGYYTICFKRKDGCTCRHFIKQ